MAWQEVQDAVKHIESISSVEAHMSQDELYEKFIRHVAEVASGELAVMAEHILTTADLDLDKWYE